MSLLLRAKSVADPEAAKRGAMTRDALALASVDKTNSGIQGRAIISVKEKSSDARKRVLAAKISSAPRRWPLHFLSLDPY